MTTLCPRSSERNVCSYSLPSPRRVAGSLAQGEASALSSRTRMFCEECRRGLREARFRHWHGGLLAQTSHGRSPLFLPMATAGSSGLFAFPETARPQTVLLSFPVQVTTLNTA